MLIQCGRTVPGYYVGTETMTEIETENGTGIETEKGIETGIETETETGTGTGTEGIETETDIGTVKQETSVNLEETGTKEGNILYLMITEST